MKKWVNKVLYQLADWLADQHEDDFLYYAEHIRKKGVFIKRRKQLERTSRPSGA